MSNVQVKPDYSKFPSVDGFCDQHGKYSSNLNDYVVNGYARVIGLSSDLGYLVLVHGDLICEAGQVDEMTSLPGLLYYQWDGEKWVEISEMDYVKLYQSAKRVVEFRDA